MSAGPPEDKDGKEERSLHLQSNAVMKGERCKGTERGTQGSALRWHARTHELSVVSRLTWMPKAVTSFGEHCLYYLRPDRDLSEQRKRVA